MKRRITIPLTAAALCLILAGCGGKEPAEAGPAAPQVPAEASVLAVPPAPEEPSAPAEPEERFSDQYTGAWRDAEDGASGGQCAMAIACEDGVHYTIDITWADDRWQYTGTYDGIWDGIDYIGARYAGEEAALEEATGLVYFDEDGVLLWEDTFEHRGDGLKFRREN